MKEGKTKHVEERLHCLLYHTAGYCSWIDEQTIVETIDHWSISRDAKWKAKNKNKKYYFGFSNLLVINKNLYIFILFL
jgi:hypothetical protein